MPAGARTHFKTSPTRKRGSHRHRMFSPRLRVGLVFEAKIGFEMCFIFKLTPPGLSRWNQVFALLDDYYSMTTGF